MPHLSIENYAMPNLVPCVVVGFESANARPEDDVMTIHVQAGGYACLQHYATGVVLRLAAAHEFARADPMPLVRAFQDISDDVTHSEGPRAPLAYAGYSSGEPLDGDDRAALERALAPFFRVPPIESGVEAFARFEVIDTLAYFEDWPVWTLAPRTGPAEATWFDCADARIGTEFVSADVERFSRAHVERLQAFARDTGIEQPVRAFLVWGNTD